MLNTIHYWMERLAKKPKASLLRDEPADESYPLIAPLGRDLSIQCLIRVPRCCYDGVGFLNKSFRAFIRSGELYKHRRDAGIAEPWIFLSCNHMVWEAFEPNFRGWIKVPIMPMDLVFLHADKESLAVGNQLLVFGRSAEDMAIYKYMVTTRTWTSDIQPMNTRRCVFASASVGTIGYVAGGVTSAGDILSTAEVYESEKGTWTEIPGMKMPRRMAAGVMMDGKFYVIGGATGGPNTDRVYLTSAEVYDPKTNTWEEIEDMGAPWVGGCGCPPLCAVVKNELYAAEVTKKEVWRYVKEKNVWVTIGKLPARVENSVGYGMAFRACGDRLVVIGGPHDGYGNGLVRIYSWVPPDPPANGGGIELMPPPEWEVIGRRKIGRFVHNCAVMSC